MKFTAFPILLSLGTNQAFQQSGRIAIARPFVAHDFANLQASFSEWPDPPCQKRDDTDMYFVYAKNLEEDEALLADVQDLAELVSTVYSKCFAKVGLLSCDISEEDNAYSPLLQELRQDWVSGPNHQFHCTYHNMQRMGYDFMYLMEADSKPLKPLWLDDLMKEVENKAPFGMLGSEYHGDKWNSFRKQLPEALLHHINGNAVYSLKDTRLDRIVEQLEDEVSTSAHGVPYDYRIAQLIVQAKEGAVAHIPSYPGFSMPSQDTILDYLGFDDSEVHDILKTTPLIGNYAATNMVDEYFDPREVIVHGAKMFDSWKTSPHSGNLTLVISDYSESAPYVELLQQMDQVKTHPFDHLLLALPPGVRANIDGKTHIPLKVFNRRQGEDSLYDYCTVLPHLETDWFILTDSHARITSKMTLMVTKEEGKPLASFADPVLSKCHEDEFCHEELEMSQQFVANNVRVFRSDDTVFSVAQMKKFCAEIDGSRPSATAYFAFLKEQHVDDSMYEFSNRAMDGSRLPFRKFNLAADEIVSLASSRILQRTSNETCEELVTESECEDLNGCVWDGSFGSCSGEPDNDCSGLFSVFCIIGNAFGGIAQFFKWLIDILTFGIFS